MTLSRIYRTVIVSIFFVAALVLVEAAFVSVEAAVSAAETVHMVPASPKQGETLAVHVAVPDGTTPPVVTFNKKTYKLYPHAGSSNSGTGSEYRALIGVPADLKPGTYELEVGDRREPVTVVPGGFGVQKIHLPKEKDNFISSPGEEAAVDKAKATASETQLWDGTFKKPSLARVSTRFGLRRMVNGHLLTDYFHSGLDFAAGQGTPVYATQRGRVILAHTGWRLHGNIVALDHGQGVVSFYLHLSRILVKPGQVVEAGSEIGKVGATGRATGPHLHFSVYVNGDATNPTDWFTRSI